MSIEKHDLHREFPEFNEEIHYLKMNDAHFLRLFNDYHKLDQEIYRIEQGIENTSDEYIDTKKKERLQHKDLLFGMIKKTQHKAALNN
ncbi:MAG: YdcH family protein [Colwellia sp.]